MYRYALRHLRGHQVSPTHSDMEIICISSWISIGYATYPSDSVSSFLQRQWLHQRYHLDSSWPWAVRFDANPCRIALSPDVAGLGQVMLKCSLCKNQLLLTWSNSVREEYNRNISISYVIIIDASNFHSCSYCDGRRGWTFVRWRLWRFRIINYQSISTVLIYRAIRWTMNSNRSSHCKLSNATLSVVLPLQLYSQWWKNLQLHNNNSRSLGQVEVSYQPIHPDLQMELHQPALCI